MSQNIAKSQKRATMSQGPQLSIEDVNGRAIITTHTTVHDIEITKYETRFCFNFKPIFRPIDFNLKNYNGPENANLRFCL